MSDSANVPVPGFHVMAKPTGPICNLDCRYCFYLEKEKLYPDKPGLTQGGLKQWAMPPEVLESFIRQHIEAQSVPEIAFAWQGGEPTLLGLDFFRKVVELEQKYADGRRITNAFQTNGVLLDDAWCSFFAENEFLIGLSIDGPEEIHDRYRVDKGGQPSFRRVMRGMECLKKNGAEFNTLTCVQRHNGHRPLDVYHFLREAGSGFMQFIPIVERVAGGAVDGDLSLVTPDRAEAAVSEWSVKPLQFGQFLSAIFDEWVRRDVGQVFVQIFDIALEAWLGMEPSLCVFQTTCGNGLAIEHNGDLYSCDHYVYPGYRLGNIMETPLPDMVNGDFQRQFGKDKAEKLPEYCKKCDVRFMCHGECPKHRFLTTPNGEPGLNYLCEGYKHFFHHIDPHMRFMANELRAQRPPANVMEYIRQQESGNRATQPPRANDPCPCGSGKKFKKCCGRQA